MLKNKLYSISKNGLRMERFYNMLVKELLGRGIRSSTLTLQVAIILSTIKIISMPPNPLYRISKTGLRMERFYNMLVKEVLDDDNSSSTSTLEVGGTSYFLQKRKNLLQVSHKSTSKSKCLNGYLKKSVADLILSIVFMAYIAIRGLPQLLEVNDAFV